MTAALDRLRELRDPAGSSLAVVVPVFNSEETIGRLVDRLVEVLEPHVGRLEIVLVDDGSTDGSHEVALEAYRKRPEVVVYVRLAKNFGEHSAVMCGLRNVSAEAAVIVDDDFQNPPEEILKLVDKLQEGYDVVYSAYSDKRHSWIRNAGSRFNDLVATRLLRKPKNLYLSSFKALNRFLIDAVVEYDGPYPYIDGLILRSTSAIASQICEHQAREVGRSNYTPRRLIRLWLNMFTSFSVVPLRLASYLGLIMSAAGVLLAGFFVVSWKVGGILGSGTIPPGWASLIVSVTLFGGIQLCVLGMIGEYVGRIFLTQNRSPQFVVRNVYRAEGFEGSTDV